jgi:hypothetical protein
VFIFSFPYIQFQNLCYVVFESRPDTGPKPQSCPRRFVICPFSLSHIHSSMYLHPYTRLDDISRISLLNLPTSTRLPRRTSPIHDEE